jgi:cyclophilin family peptidyl-prolyl cis-trans isomerase
MPLRMPLLLVNLSLGIALTGCSRPDPIVTSADPQNQGADPGKPGPPAGPAVNYDSWLHHPFAKATIAEPPEGQLRPPDRTVAGQSVAPMYEKIVGENGAGGLWDAIKFHNPQGKRLSYEVVLTTDKGSFMVELRPDLAPNHVRNFLALCKVGYYEGLPFHRTVRQEIQGDKPAKLELVEVGCPLGSGEPGYGSIGYWMRPEVNDKVSHEEGTLGAWHAEEVESAACRFYITLTKAPFMDGYWTIFGKVSRGLDVVRTIHRGPIREDDEFDERPRDPVFIRQVTVNVREVGTN